MPTRRKITVQLTGEAARLRHGSRVTQSTVMLHVTICQTEQDRWPSLRRDARKENHLMQRSHIKHHTSTADLNREVVASLAPQGIRRAKAVAPRSEKVATYKQTPKRGESRSRTLRFLVLGFLCGLILIVLGTIVARWVEDVTAHWHGGDGYVATLDADVGHGGGSSHFLAFCRQGYVVVVEFSHDYSSTHAYTLPVTILDHGHHAVQLAVAENKRDLTISLDGGSPMTLYNTGDTFSMTH